MREAGKQGPGTEADTQHLKGKGTLRCAKGHLKGNTLVHLGETGGRECLMCFLGQALSPSVNERSLGEVATKGKD